jgi:hypothetical protein
VDESPVDGRQNGCGCGAGDGLIGLTGSGPVEQVVPRRLDLVERLTGLMRIIGCDSSAPCTTASTASADT